MTSQVKLEPTAMPGNDALLLWLFIAAVIHVLVIMGVNFSQLKPEKFDRSLDITIVNIPAKKAPKEAKILAQENQIGAGEENIKPQAREQKIANRGYNVKQKSTESEPVESKARTIERVITQHHAEKKVAPVQADEENRHVESHPQLSPELLQQQITQLGTEIRHSQQSGDQSKIKTVNMVSAHKYVAAQYLKDWEDKVERMGNLNYPEIAIKKNFSASLSMDVGIKVDGSIYSMRISRSSGIPELDEAAKNIVRMSAPFAPLPLELQKQLNVLVITRVWKFSDESGMTTR